MPIAPLCRSVRGQTSTLSSSGFCLEHRTSKIYVLAVATVLPPNHMLTGYALCTPILGQFRAWVGFFGRLRRRRFHLPSRSANFPVGTFVYSKAKKATDGASARHTGTRETEETHRERHVVHTGHTISQGSF
eukprot:scaffold16912_cov112-Isochrysis_galbana.AAC.8